MSAEALLRLSLLAALAPTLYVALRLALALLADRARRLSR